MTQLHRCNKCGSEDIRTACNHANFVIVGSEPIGKATCRDCHETVEATDAFNSLAHELRTLIKDAEKCLTNLKVTR